VYCYTPGLRRNHPGANLRRDRLSTAYQTDGKPTMLKKLLLSALLLTFAAGASAFEFVDSKGKPQTLSQYKGKWVLVNYWATWCPPCLEEIPDLADLHKDKKNNLVVLGVAVNYQNPKQVTDFAARLDIPYPIILGDNQKSGEVEMVPGLPTSYLYNPQGKRVAYQNGILSREAVERYITKNK
jgi:thiol-disulfide isomerase/thioredoxin